MKKIEDIIEDLKEDYDVHKVTDVPLYGGQHQYLINVITKPTYSREQGRLWSIEDMEFMKGDSFKSRSLLSYTDLKGDIKYYKRGSQ